MRKPVKSGVVFLATMSIAFGGALSADPASAAAQCDRHASPTGSDGNSGTAQSPFRTAQKLADSLRAGETGCLAAGATFAESGNVLRIANGGEPGSPITITSTAGGRATLRGRVWFTADGHDVVVENIFLDGRNSKNHASPQIEADRVTFRGNEVTNFHTGICFLLGQTSGEYAAAPRGLVLEGNRIHDCGRLPRTNRDHGIYVESTRGARIVGNWIYDNADRGVQLYPDSQGTLVERNVIDGNGTGVQFGGSSTLSSSGNLVRENVITNSQARGNLEASWFGPVGSGNVAQGNCLFGGSSWRGDGNIGEEIGFRAVDNVSVNPGYANRAAKDFSIAADSPCAGKAPRLPPGTQPQPSSPGASSAVEGPIEGAAAGNGAAARYGARATRRFAKGRWLRLSLTPPAGAYRSVITRKPSFGTRNGRRVFRPAGSIRVPLPRRNGRVDFTVRFRDRAGKVLGGDRVRVVVDRTSPRARLLRGRGSRVRVIARDPGGIRKVRFSGAGLRKTVTPRRPPVRIATHLRVTSAKRLTMVVFDRAGNSRVVRA